MKSFLISFVGGFLVVAPYIIVLFILLHTYMAVTATTIYLALFNAFAACVNGLCFYYIQTRNHSQGLSC